MCYCLGVGPGSPLLRHAARGIALPSPGSRWFAPKVLPVKLIELVLVA